MKRSFYFTLLLLTAFFYSCKSVEKQRRQAQEFYKAHPSELADKCAEEYPPKIEYKPGQMVLIPGDTVIIKGDSVQCPEVAATPTRPVKPGIKIKCPDSRVIVDTIRIVDTATVENTARVNSIRYRLDTVSGRLTETEQALEKAEGIARARMWWIVALLILIFIAVVLRIRKII